MERLMNERIRGGLKLLVLMGLAVGVLTVGVSGASAREIIYNNIVSPLPGNYASQAFEATSTAEYGGEVEFGATARKHAIVTVAMSAWACQQGNMSENNCATPKPKQKFKWPLTLSVYNVGPGDTVGSKLIAKTRTFGMPYRPSQSVACAEKGSPGAWMDEATKECFHGKAFTLSFHLGMKAPLPAKAIVSLANNTSNYGEKPTGGKEACNSSAAGCYYDSLNFAVVEPAEKALTVGSDPTESQFVNSNWAEMYCGKTESLNMFAPSGVCPAWYEGDQPAIKVEAG
jgi:hypothetical protein